MRIAMSEATPKQLRAFAASLGLEVLPTQTGDRLRALIASAWSEDHIDLPADEATAVQVDTVQPPKASKRVKVVIADEENGINPVPIGVNGRVITIIRGHEVEIEPEYLEALKNAKRQIAVQDRNGALVGMREVQTFPFQVVG